MRVIGVMVVVGVPFVVVFVPFFSSHKTVALK